MTNQVERRDKAKRSGASCAKIGRQLTSRRSVLKGAAAVAAMPAFIGRATADNRQVVVRTPGGAVGEADQKVIYEPFTAETGIKVIAVPTSVGKIFAMHRAGHIELDVVESSKAQLYDLSVAGALAPLQYDKFKYTDPNDIDAADKSRDSVGNWQFTTAITYNSKAFNDKHPANWSQFWDVKAFPGKRVLQGLASGELPLEFALLADGVALNKLYPLDLDRAFKSMDRIKKDVVSFYSNAASVLEMLTNEEATAAALWNGQGQAVHDSGGPIAVDMNQSMMAGEGLAVVAGCKNPANAQLLVDYSLQPKCQAAVCSRVPYGPVNRRAMALMSKKAVAVLPNNEQNASRVFRRDIVWWHNNWHAVSDRWNKWLLQ